jgi:putative DNA primase/helicase
MKHDRKLQIATAGSRKSMNWQTSSIMWSEFCGKLKTPVRSSETLQEYLGYTKSRQDDLKDVGGFVGGSLNGGRRKADAVTGRDLVSLDFDNIPRNGTGDVLKRVGSLGCGAAIYSTRKHSDYAPRLRVILPLDRTVTPDEYEPIARKLAALIGISYADPTTFEVHRLMYWPNCCSDSQYIYEVYDLPFCSADGVLDMYEDWHDITSWPQVPGVEAIEKRRLAKKEDPTSKRGIVGAFCRAYTVTEAMDKYIPGMYDETGIPGRYTYTGGSTTGGAIVYDADKFLYSHHATDPCSGKLVNAWDLIRLHMFGDRDDQAKEGTPIAKMPSYLAMKALAASDAKVKELVDVERRARAKEAFAKTDDSGDKEEETDNSWMDQLTTQYSNSLEREVCIDDITNARIILANDPEIKGKIAFDEFSNRITTAEGLPWNPDTERRGWTKADDYGVYEKLGHTYGMKNTRTIDAAIMLEGVANKYNEVKSYILSVKWDGKKRLDTLLSDYLGADDTPYTRAVMRKSLAAAAGRAVYGGIKYDYMPIFAGPQGIGKSTFLSILGKDWFSDSLTSFSGKDSMELIQGTWINEVGELAAMTKYETSDVKQFLSKTRDRFRAAYGHRPEEFPRRCVFFGTTNDTEFLKDRTGNRRFWPVNVGLKKAKKSIWEDLPAEVDQIWAEALCAFVIGEKLYMPPELEKLVLEAQKEHQEGTEKEGIIMEFLDTPVPENWDSLTLNQKRMALHGGGARDMEKIKIYQTCAAEIWELLFGRRDRMRRSDAMEINGILKQMPGWEPKRIRIKDLGPQRGFIRCDKEGVTNA